MKKRILSALVFVPLALVCTFASIYSRVLLLLAAGIACAYELSVNLEKQEVFCSLRIMLSYLIVQAVLCLLQAGITAYCGWFIACIYLTLLSGIARKRVSGHGAMDTTAGLTYPCMMFGVLMAIGSGDLWAEALTLGCLSSWVCDAFALFGGSLFGKHKLASRISPHKTVEGFISGEIFGTAAGAALWALGLALQKVPAAAAQFRLLPVGVCLLTAFAASTMGQLGDLAESLLKRMLGVKDFSNLIPGHGGMFDRMDSLLFAIPTAYVCLRVYLYFFVG